MYTYYEPNYPATFFVETQSKHKLLLILHKEK